MDKYKMVMLIKIFHKRLYNRKMLLVMLILTSILCVNLISAGLINNLTGWWEFQGDGTDSHNGYDGIEQNSPTYTSGKIGSALTLNGKNQLVNLTNSPNWDLDSGEMSVAAWINTVGPIGVKGAIIGRHDGASTGYWLGWDTDNKLSFTLETPYYVTVVSDVVSLNTWHLVVLTRNSTTQTLWLNNTILNFTDIRDGSNLDEALRFGSSTNNFFNGSLDGMAIWNRGLDDSEVNDLWNSGSGISYVDVEHEVTLYNPISNYNTTNLLSIPFNCSAHAIINDISNITLFIDGVANHTHIGESDNFTELYHTVPRLETGSVDWTCRAYDNETTVFWAVNRTLNMVEGFAENYQIFNSTTAEGSIEDFEISISYNATLFPNIQANLVYNSTSYAGFSSGIGSTKIFRRTLNIPEIVIPVNISFHWQIELMNSTGTFYFNSTIQNQTVSDINIDNCTVYTNEIFNFTIIDEEDQDSISANNSIEFLINIYNADRSILISNYSNQFNNSSLSICMDSNLSISPASYIVDSTIKYSAQDHEIEYYNIADYSLTNGSELQNIFLYDLLTADSTEFQLTFTGSDFLAVEDALVFVKRQYVSENVFKTVELPKTDSNGQTIIHLVKNDIIYNIEIMKAGVVIGNFENIIAFCEDVVIGDCKINLGAADSGEAVFNYDDALGITYTGPTYNNATRIITFNFLSTDGSVKNVLMNATRNDIFGNRTVCSASLVSSGGTLTCEVPSHIEDSTIITKVFIDGIEVLKNYTILSEFNFGKPGYFIFFIYMLAFILMFSRDKSVMLIGIVVGFITGIGLGLVSGSLTGIGASGIWLIIVVILMIWKLNRERPN